MRHPFYVLPLRAFQHLVSVTVVAQSPPCSEASSPDTGLLLGSGLIGKSRRLDIRLQQTDFAPASPSSFYASCVNVTFSFQINAFLRYEECVSVR